MLAVDITINPSSTGGANANNLYKLIGFPTNDSSLRRVTATAGTTPEELTVKHQSLKRGALTYQRHLLRVDQTFIDSIQGPVKVAAWVVVEHPQGVSAVALTQQNEVLGRLHAALAVSGLKDAVLAGEM